MSEFEGMKVSYLIERLKEEMEEHGDLPVQFISSYKKPRYCVSGVTFIDTGDTKLIELTWGFKQRD